MDEQGERHFAPLDAGLEVGVDESPPSPHVETLEEAGLGDMIGPPDATRRWQVVIAHRVAEGDDRCVLVDLDAALLGVDVGGAGFEFGGQFQFTRAQASFVTCGVEGEAARVGSGCDKRVGAEPLEEEGIDGVIAAVSEGGCEFESAVPLALVGDPYFFSVGELVNLRRAQVGKHIILVSRYELVEGRSNVVPVTEAEVVLGELALQVGLLVETVGQFCAAIHVVRPCSVGQVSAPEEVRIQVGCGQTRYAETPLVVVVVTDDGVDGTKVELVVLQRVGSLDEVLEQGFHSHHEILESANLGDAVQERLHLLLRLCEFNLAQRFPVGFVGVHTGIWLDKGLSLHVLERTVGDFVEGIVKLAGGVLHLQFSEPRVDAQFDEHVVADSHTGTVADVFVVLVDGHRLHPVHITALGYGQFHAAHLIRRIFHHIDMARESDVLLVVGNETDVDDAVAFDA